MIFQLCFAQFLSINQKVESSNLLNSHTWGWSTECSKTPCLLIFIFVHSDNFLSSLPELLTLVVKDNPEMAAMVIATMKKAACQNCAGVLDLISRHSLIWFCEYGSKLESFHKCCLSE